MRHPRKWCRRINNQSGRWWIDGTAEDVGNLCIGIEDGRTKRKRSKKRRNNWIWLEKVKHVFSRLLEVSFLGEAREGNFFGEKIDRENVSLGIGVGKITLPATVVRKGRANVPANLAVLAKGSAIVVGNMGNDAGTTRSKGGPIEIEVTKKRGVCRKRRMDTRRSQEIESQSGLR